MSFGWVMFSPIRSLTSSYMKTSFNHTLKHNDDVRGKSKSLHKAPSHATRSELRATYLQETSAPHPFTEFALNTQTDEQFSPHWGSNQWNLRHHQGLAMVRHLKPIWYDPSLLEAENIAPIMTVRNTRLSIVGPSRSTWKGLSNKISSKSTSSLSRQPPNPDSSTLHRLPSHNI